MTKMDRLTQLANDLELGRYTYPLAASLITDAEQSLSRNPDDMFLRAGLLRYYARSRESHLTELLTHLKWFVTNVPDCRFCSETVFYLNQDEMGYADLAKLWIDQASKSDSLMRRINAYLFLMSGEKDGASLEKYFDRFFSQHLNNIWVKAVSNPSNWFEESCEEILNKHKLHSKQLANVRHDGGNSGALRRTAANAASRGIPEQVFWNQLETFRASYDLTALAFVIGYTAGRCQVESWIGFNPDITISRFEALSWIILNIPSLPLARSPFALVPFQNDWKTSPVIKLNEYLSNLWVDKLNEDEDLQIIENAVNFVISLQIAKLPAPVELINRIQCTTNGMKVYKRVLRMLENDDT